MKKWFIRFFGLKGSFRWACRQMDKGYIVHRTTDMGVAKYKMDSENQRRIQWAFVRKLDEAEWKNANIFLSDFECVNWAIFSHQHLMTNY